MVLSLADDALGKIGGILVETKRMGDVQRIVIGVGLNLFTPDVPNAEGAPAYRAHSLIRAMDEPTQTRIAQLAAVARQLCVAMITSWVIFEKEGWLAFRDEWAAFDALLGRPVTVIESEAKQWGGHHLGLDDQGQLRVMTDGGERRVLVGDVSLRSLSPKR